MPRRGDHGRGCVEGGFGEGAVTPETTKGAFRRPFTNRSACHRPLPAWLCDGWLPRILRVSQAPFGNSASMPENNSAAIGGKAPLVLYPLHRNPSALRTAAFIAEN